MNSQDLTFELISAMSSKSVQEVSQSELLGMKQVMDKVEIKGPIKRPMNPFLVFSQQRRKEISMQHPKMHNSEISKILGNEWHDLTADQKQPYVDKSRRIRDALLKANPNYKYQPRRKKKVKTVVTYNPPPPPPCCSNNVPFQAPPPAPPPTLDNNYYDQKYYQPIQRIHYSADASSYARPHNYNEVQFYNFMPNDGQLQNVNIGNYYVNNQNLNTQVNNYYPAPPLIQNYPQSQPQPQPQPQPQSQYAIL